MAELRIVGAGPGSTDYVTPAAKKAVQDAQLVIGAERSLNLFRDDIHGETLTLTAKNVDEALKYANESARKGKTVALLSTGDPGFSGLLGSVLRKSMNEGVKVKVIPGVSSMQVCAAKLGMSWDDINLFAFHADTNSQKKNALVGAVKAGNAVMLLPDPKAFTPSDIAGFLMSNGVNKQTPVAVCENLTLSDERVVETTLEEASKQKFASLSVMVIRSDLNP